MVDVPAAWLKSGEYAYIAGHKLRPVENTFLRDEPLVVARGHSRAYYLRDENNIRWILKKFFPGRTPSNEYLQTIKTLVPDLPGFQTGYRRQVIKKEDIQDFGFFNPDFLCWIEKTILMTRLAGTDWAFLIDKVRSGSFNLPRDERLVLCRNLSEKIKILEDNNISHRSLSRTSVFIDIKDQSIELINWDEIFHPTLAIPPNRTIGSLGYIAPFIRSSGTPDPLITWRPQADRFSLAMLNSEFLGLRAYSPLYGDGSLFNQQDLYARKGESVNLILNTLKQNFPGAGVLLKKALEARNYDECPSPAEWLAFSSGVQFYSCFISYSNKDSEFAQRLHSRLRDAGLRVWFAPEDVKGGVKLFEQVDKAIEMHDRLLLVLSEHSMRSNWVQEEIRRARKFERVSGHRKLFPIRLTDFETLQEWSCMDTVAVEDLADEIRSFFIPDFSNWKNYDDFERAFERLLGDLKPGA